MKCDVCGKEIAYEATFFQMETGKESVCSDECLMKRMLEEITSSQIDECFAGNDFRQENERFRQGGLSGLTSEDKEILFDWYKDNFAWKCENDEPDEMTLRECEAEKRYEMQEYYRMVRPA